MTKYLSYGRIFLALCMLATTVGTAQAADWTIWGSPKSGDSSRGSPCEYWLAQCGHRVPLPVRHGSGTGPQGELQLRTSRGLR